MTKQTKDRVIPATSLSYRPRDYFGRYDMQTELMTRVKGTLSRQALRNALDVGGLAQIPEEVKQAALDEPSRQMIGRIHPSFMGGEYLPRIKSGDVEIARISIQSTTGDVTCLYARPVGGRIVYRMADEYEGSTLEQPTTRTSTKPLTMGQMISFFLKSWNLFECLECNYEGDPDRQLAFFTAESEYYPYFDEALREMVLSRSNEKDSIC